MRRAIVLAAIATLAALGCARNAVLEVELTLPPQPAGAPARYAVVQFETGDIDFEADWERTDDYDGTELGEMEQVVRYSVVSGEEHERVRVKVRFCTTPACTAIADSSDRAPALWFDLEHPLYVGERTTWRHTIDAVPTDPPTAATFVDKCEIAGCIVAGSEGTSYCRLGTRTHYCE